MSYSAYLPDELVGVAVEPSAQGAVALLEVLVVLVRFP